MCRTWGSFVSRVYPWDWPFPNCNNIFWVYRTTSPHDQEISRSFRRDYTSQNLATRWTLAVIERPERLKKPLLYLIYSYSHASLNVIFFFKEGQALSGIATQLVCVAYCASSFTGSHFPWNPRYFVNHESLNNAFLRIHLVFSQQMAKAFILLNLQCRAIENYRQAVSSSPPYFLHKSLVICIHIFLRRLMSSQWPVTKPINRLSQHCSTQH